MEEENTKIQQIMSKLNQKQETRTELAKPPDYNTPKTFDEFLAIEKLQTWPMKITSEELIDLKEEHHMLCSQSGILEELREGTDLDFYVLRNLEDKLSDFERSLNTMADKIVVDPKPQRGEESSLPLSVNKVFLTDMSDRDSIKVHPSRKKRNTDLQDAVLETRRRGVDSCIFPGFRKSELTELPAQLEAPPLLNRVSKAQPFNSGFEKFWTKIFQSEASVAMMQDSFWWIFIEHFQKQHSKEQSLFFDRIADSFVALFTSVNPEIKDKVFLIYADCLAQALFLTFREAFPESERYFNDTFKQELLNISYEWIHGSRPPAGSWSKWNTHLLQPQRQKAATSGTDPMTRRLVEVAVLHKPVSQSLEMEEFHQLVSKLGVEESENKAKNEANFDGKPSNENRRKKTATESCPVGPGPELERVMFSMKGRSPLVAHFLRMRQLTDSKDTGRKIRRTQVAKAQKPGPTYRHVIQDSLSMQDTLSKEYQKICTSIAQEINKIDREQRQASRKIEQLQKEILFCKSSSEVKQIKARILDPEPSSPTRIGHRDDEGTF